MARVTDELPSRGAVAVAVLVLVGVAAAALLGMRPPAPAPADAPPGRFSAERAMGTVTAIAQVPRPLGSGASDAARDLLVDRLAELGLRTEVTDAVGARSSGGKARAGRVQNVVATLPGTDPTGAVVLVAHYDSVAAGPGAADDAAAVAATLETIRAVRAGPPLRNDLVVLLTDGEEDGLLGASAFVAADPLRGRPAVVLNWEARGSSGPSLMFQTSPGNARLVAAYAAVAPHPSGDSSLVELYRFLPNDTDLSVFLDAGRPGLNFAFVEDPARYHTPGDNLENLSRASLQHHGSAMLALARELGRVDLAPFDPAVSGAAPVGDSTYFRFPGTFVTYANERVLPLAVAAVVAVGAAAVAARRRGLLTLRGLAGGFASLVLPLVLAGLLAQGLWLALVAVRPAYRDIGPFLQQPLLLRLAVLALAVLALTVWGLLLRRGPGAWALGCGAAAWLAVLGVLTALATPGVSFLFAVPALGIGLGALAGVVARGTARPIVLAAGAVPLVVVLLPFVLSMFDGSGMAGAFVPAVAAVLLGGPLALVVAGLPVRAPVAALPLIAAVALAGAGLAVDRPDPAHPQRADLAYLLDAGTGTAHWISRDLAPADWTARYVPDGPRQPGPGLPWPGTEPLRTGPAPELDVPAPAVTRTTAADGSIVLAVTSRRGAPVVGVRSDAGIASAQVTLDGHPPVRFDLGGEPLDLRAGDVPAGGMRIVLRPAEPGPVHLDVRDETVGLGGVPGFEPRPAELSRSAHHDGDAVVVHVPSDP